MRAGCTPKFKDVDTLCSMLTYGDGMPHLVKPEALGPGCYRYSDYPADEFMVDRVSIEQGGAALGIGIGIGIGLGVGIGTASQ